MNRQNQGLSGFSGFLDDLLSVSNPHIFGESTFAPNKNKGIQNVPVNLKEDENAFYLDVIAPGISKEDIKLQIDENILNISFEAVKEEASEEVKDSAKVLKNEYVIRSFKRSFKLGNKVDVDKISAKYENGILKLDLPKKAAVIASNKTIAIA